jgi:hypothetical protein
VTPPAIATIATAVIARVTRLKRLRMARPLSFVPGARDAAEFEGLSV